MAKFLLENDITDMLSQCIYQKRLFMISTWTVYLLFLTQIVLSKDSKSASDPIELQCPPCEQIFCTPKNAKRLQCKGGITTGICNCCPVCAKVEGEKCGGLHNFRGKCDTGLTCVLENNDHNINDVLKSEYSTEKFPLKSNAEGTCRRRALPEVLGDMPSVCEEKCTPEFCEKNPRAICSAIENADDEQKCQGECQHTSCRACRYVFDSNHCGKCNKDDYKCMKKFGQCIRKQTCSRNSFPCKKSKFKNRMLKEAIFKCTVPDCL